MRPSKLGSPLAVLTRANPFTSIGCVTVGKIIGARRLRRFSVGKPYGIGFSNAARARPVKRCKRRAPVSVAVTRCVLLTLAALLSFAPGAFALPKIKVLAT